MNAPPPPPWALVAPSGRLAPPGWLAAALIGLAGTALALYATSRWGPGISPDSVGYVAAARSFAAGQGWLSYNGHPVIVQPTGLATVLGLVALAGPDPAASVGPVNALAVGLTLFACAAWLLARLRSPVLALLGATTLLLFQPLLFVATMAWSEALFLLWATLCLMAAERYRAGGTAGPLVLAGLLAGLACVTRYAGAPLIPAVLVLVALRRGDPWRPRLIRGALFSVLALLPVGLWLLRNLVVAGTMFGSRHEGTGDVAGVLAESARVVRTWLLPAHGTAGVHGLAVAALAAVVLLAGAGLWAGRQRRVDPGPWPPLAAWLLFGAIYWAFIVAVKTRIGGLEIRYLDPLVVPLIFALLAVLDRALAAGRAALPFPRVYAAALPLALLLWLGAHPAPMALGYADLAHRSGVPGYTADYWRDRPIVRALSRLEPDGYVLSNAPDLVYWLTGTPAAWLPLRDEAKGPAARRLTAPVAARLAAGEPVYVILVRHEKRPHLADLPELDALFVLEVLWADPGRSGAILRVAALRPGTPR